MELTQEERVAYERGLRAEALLQDTNFVEVVNYLVRDCAIKILETKPEEQSKREEHYNLYRGLAAIEAELNALVHEKTMIQARIDADETPSEY